MWDIIKKDDYKLFINTNISFLRLKVCEKDEYTEIYVDYNGYNLIHSMVFGYFVDECDGENIPFVFCGLSSYSETYFIINNEDIDRFINVIYSYIILNFGYVELDEKYKVNWDSIENTPIKKKNTLIKKINTLIKKKNTPINWIITEKKEHKVFFNEETNLKLNVYEKDTHNEIHIDYEGHNILFVIKVRGFRSYCKKYGIQENMGGNPLKSKRNLYFIINKKDTSFFINLIYKFIKEMNLNNVKFDGNKIELLDN